MKEFYIATIKQSQTTYDYFIGKDPFFDPNIRASARIGPHRYEILSIFYGTLLGDAFAEKHGFGTRIHFHQSSANIEYLHWLHKNVSQYGYCTPQIPKITKQIGKNNKIYFNLKFRTWTFTSLNGFYQDWYDENIHKILPHNIQDYLNPISLAYMIIDDGSFTGYGVKIATDCFKEDEVYRLKQCIENTFSFKVNIHCHNKKHRLYIPKQSMNLLIPIVKPYICQSILYKLGQ